MKFNKTKKNKVPANRSQNLAGGESFKAQNPKLGLAQVTINNLMENKYYESDEESLEKIKKRFDRLADSDPQFILGLAKKARQDMYLRDVPQVLLVLAANDDRTKKYVREWAPEIIQRADELSTVIAVQLKLFGKPIPNALRNGVADAFHNFDRYQFSKYKNKSREVSLVDVMNLVRPEPENEEEAEIFEKIVKGNLDDYDVESLDPPETWEVVISEEGNNKEAWLSVLDRMGLFARIRNMRNMLECGIDPEKIVDEEDLDYIRDAKLYPFRFYQSYRAIKDAGFSNKYLEKWLSDAIEKAAENVPEELGDTFVGVDMSGSMTTSLSENSTITYKEISAMFGAILSKKSAKVSGFARDFKVFNTHYDTPIVELVDKYTTSNIGVATNGWKVVKHLRENQIEKDRIILFTDMQIWDTNQNGNTVREEFNKYKSKVNPNASLYIVDLASYGDLVMPEGAQDVYRIRGWSQKIFDFIDSVESKDALVSEIEEELEES